MSPALQHVHLLSPKSKFHKSAGKTIMVETKSTSKKKEKNEGYVP